MGAIAQITSRLDDPTEEVPKLLTLAADKACKAECQKEPADPRGWGENPGKRARNSAPSMDQEALGSSSAGEKRPRTVDIYLYKLNRNH